METSKITFAKQTSRATFNKAWLNLFYFLMSMPLSLIWCFLTGFLLFFSGTNFKRIQNFSPLDLVSIWPQSPLFSLIGKKNPLDMWKHIQFRKIIHIVYGEASFIHFFSGCRFNFLNWFYAIIQMIFSLIVFKFYLGSCAILSLENSEYWTLDSGDSQIC